LIAGYTVVVVIDEKETFYINRCGNDIKQQLKDSDYLTTILNTFS